MQRVHGSWAALLSCLFFLAGSQFARAQDSADRDKLYQDLADEVSALSRHLNLLKRVVAVVQPTVVHIDAQKSENDGFSRPKTVEEAGSGAIIQYKGKHYVLTNLHVIKNASLTNIDIKLADARVIHPTRVWSDPGTDIAVMAITAADIVPSRLGNSDPLEIGDFVIAVGSPFGLSNSVTFGIISAKGRRDLELGDSNVKLQDFLQTDAAINPGNSGGPLLNLKGEVVGINTAIASASGGNEGIGFSIPINMVMHVARQLIDRGVVQRAFLGVNLDARFDAAEAARLGLPLPRGAKVTGITASSPAERAQIQIGDVIVEFNGHSVENDTHLVNLVSLTPVNKEVPVLIYRNRKPVEIKVTVGDRDAFQG